MQHITEESATPENEKPHVLSDRAMTEAMIHESPEGRPAEPSLRRKGMYRIVGMAGVLVLLVAVGIGVVGGSWVMAGAAAGVGLVGLLVANPVVWAAMARGKERGEADEKYDIAYRHEAEGHSAGSGTTVR